MIELIIKASDADDLMAQLRVLLSAPAKVQEVPPTAVYVQPKAKPKKAPKPARPVDDPDVIDDVDDGNIEVFEPKEQPVEELFAEEEAKVDPAKLLKLKSETISILQDAFAQGKVVKLRKLLMTHGDGAKSFPEVDPVKFIEISEAVKAGALNG